MDVFSKNHLNRPSLQLQGPAPHLAQNQFEKQKQPFPKEPTELGCCSIPKWMGLLKVNESSHPPQEHSKKASTNPNRLQLHTPAAGQATCVSLAVLHPQGFHSIVSSHEQHERWWSFWQPTNQPTNQPTKHMDVHTCLSRLDDKTTM